ncbi:MAG: methyltransferase [Desulfobacteraceae bacterium 4572_35.1]|nr:MAG: methyltransferase [Desulfobacteraceae bacterium 4572_35.1]
MEQQNKTEISTPDCCPLCGGMSGFFVKDKRRSYYRCQSCLLVFVASVDHLDESTEKAVYDQHQNDPSDIGYRLFLNRLFQPLSSRLPPEKHGLDFGSGPGPTLSLMFSEVGHDMTIYDHYYAKDSRVWQKTYDFISTTEVVEHLYHPRFELERLWSHLSSGGLLGVMTKMVRDVDAFSRWHYKNDPTHVCFYAPQTFMWLADHWGAQLEFIGDDVVIFAKA